MLYDVMMLTMRPRMAITTCVVLLLLCAACRKQRVLTVTLPPSYTGTVSLNCTALVDSDVQIDVGPQGQADTTCPMRKPSDPTIDVYRDGKQIKAEDANWGTTGDGIVRELSFKVR